MTPPTQSYTYENPIDISISNYRLIDSLKDKFSISDTDKEEVNSFLCYHNDINNVFINLLLDISDKVNDINPNITLSLKIIRDEFYYEELLKISAKIVDFEETYKLEELNDNLYDKYISETLDKIILSMEF